MKRKVTQIAATDNHVYALCDDGTIWNWNCEGTWKEWPPTAEIPEAPDSPKLPKYIGENTTEGRVKYGRS